MCLQVMGDLLPDDLTEAERRQITTGVLASMVGGLILGRGLPEPEALQILDDCRSFLGRELASNK